MPKINFSSITDVFKKYSPDILQGLGITGMITTTILAVKSTPKAYEKLQEKHHEKHEKLNAKEIVQVTWRYYILPAATCVVSVSCLIGASSVHHRRNAALATAYALSESAFKDYRGKVIETVGERKDKAIQDQVAKDHIDNNPPSTEVIPTCDGIVLCYDVPSGRYFHSTHEKIKKAENYLNYKLRNELYVALNDFYDELDISHTDFGDLLGWNVDNGYIEIGFSSHLTDNNIPCLAINYSVAPSYNYFG